MQDKIDYDNFVNQLLLIGIVLCMLLIIACVLIYKFYKNRKSSQQPLPPPHQHKKPVPKFQASKPHLLPIGFPRQRAIRYRLSPADLSEVAEVPQIEETEGIPSRNSNGVVAGSARGGTIALGTIGGSGAACALGNAAVEGTTQLEGILASGPGALEDEEACRKGARLNIGQE